MARGREPGPAQPAKRAAGSSGKRGWAPRVMRWALWGEGRVERSRRQPAAKGSRQGRGMRMLGRCWAYPTDRTYSVICKEKILAFGGRFSGWEGRSDSDCRCRFSSLNRCWRPVTFWDDWGWAVIAPLKQDCSIISLKPQDTGIYLAAPQRCWNSLANEDDMNLLTVSVSLDSSPFPDWPGWTMPVFPRSSTPHERGSQYVSRVDFVQRVVGQQHRMSSLAKLRH